VREPSLEKLETIISYILIFGVVASVIIETVGIISHYYSEGNINITFEPRFALKGANLFIFIGSTFQDFLRGSFTSLNILNLGLALLMITPYIRVVSFSGLLRHGQKHKILLHNTPRSGDPNRKPDNSLKHPNPHNRIIIEGL
jgi:uncharacterized membrane protein